MSDSYEEPTMNDGNAEPEQPPAPPPPEIDYGKLAKSITEGLVSSARAAAPIQQQQVSRREQVYADMLKDGVPEKAIKQLAQMMHAEFEDREQVRHAKEAEAAAHNFNNAMFAKAEESLAKYSGSIKGFDTLMPGLVKKMSDICANDPEFDGFRKSRDSWKLPAATYFDKAAQKAIDEFVDKAGLVRKTAPIEHRSSAPAKAKTGDEAFDVQGLDTNLRKLYLAVRNSTGNEKLARQAVHDMERAGR